MVDDEHVHQPPRGLQFQSELLLHGGEEAGLRAILDALAERAAEYGFVGGELEIEIVARGETGFVQDREEREPAAGNSWMLLW